MRVKFISQLSKAFVGMLSDELYCKWRNLRNGLRGEKLKIYPGVKCGYRLAYQEEKLHIARRSRERRYKKGIDRHIGELVQQYSLAEIGLKPNGLMVDCGANIGELGVWARANGLEYFAIEPEPLEADVCDQNNFCGKKMTLRKALWEEDSTLTFYSEPDSADSSLFETGNFQDKTTVATIRLDNLHASQNWDRIHLFKLEAEGAEPEILEGARGVLPKIDYIAVDCGCERGINLDHTFVEVNAILLEYNFELIEAQFDRVTMLYRNKAII